MTQPPFALFVLDKDINSEYLDESLKRAYDGNELGGWQLWVATDSYDDLPPRQEPRKPPPDATKPPLPKDFTSPWVGKTVEDCAKWLQQSPGGVDKDYFTVMNEFSREDDTVLVCRVEHAEDGDGFKVEYIPQPTNEISMQMFTNFGIKFDEKALNYQRRRLWDGKPDRSRAGPY